jgi:UDP-N-acetyl-D-glucosamine dehydrogenase
MDAASVSAAEVLGDKIQNRTAHVGVVGLGYVGLLLAVEFARAGFRCDAVTTARWAVIGMKR